MRILIVLLSALAMALLFWEPIYVLPILIPVGIVLPLWLYYESWQIVFGTDGITKKVFLSSGRSYYWHQLRSVQHRHSYTEGQQIIMEFTDGKTLVFRLEDQNASKALSKISTHRSITKY